MNLVTGASGLLGHHVVLELLVRGEKIRALNRSAEDGLMVRKLARFYGIDHRIEWSNLQWFECDIMDITRLNESMDGIERVFHCAAVVSYHKKDRSKMYNVNIEGTANVVNTAMNNGIKRLCHTSSISALGRQYHMQTVNEDDEWRDSKMHTHYAITKHHSESEVWRGIVEGLNAFIVNPSLIIGPGKEARSSGAIFEHLKKQWNYFPAGGTGMVHVRDVANCMVNLMEKGINARRYTITSENIEYKRLWQLASSKMNLKIPQKQLPPWLPKLALMFESFKELLMGKRASVTKESIGNMQLRFLYDNSRIVEELNYKFLPAEVAIDDAIEFLRFE
ncbi:MAG: NAD-dependent epimerase/dehydratase family protein [Flavobacteriales bacterium]|nr:NAD-dependent epimerase/dehydratase family protein [Flavobacteriales bacterium]